MPCERNVTFFTHSTILEGEEKELPVGMSKYQFSFPLPEDGKSSFKESFENGHSDM